MLKDSSPKHKKTKKGFKKGLVKGIKNLSAEEKELLIFPSLYQSYSTVIRTI